MLLYHPTCVLASIALASVALASIATASHADSLVGSPGDVAELSHKRELVLHPHWIEVIDSHVFAANGSNSATTAVFEFELPRAAVIRSLQIRARGKSVRAITVDAEAAIQPLPGRGGTNADLGLLREIGARDALSRYQLVLHPVTKSSPLSVQISWSHLTVIEGDRVSVRLPQRAKNPKIPGTEFRARAIGSRGLRLKDLRINGIAAGSKEVAVDQSKYGVAVQARIETSGRAPMLLEAVATPLAANTWSLSIGAVSPSVTLDSQFDSVVIAVDVSRSMTRPGLDIAKRVALEIAEQMRGANIEVVLFDRNARRLFGAPKRLTRQARERIGEAIDAAPLANGSDLRAGIHAAANALHFEAKTNTKSSALVVVSDNHAPRALDRDALRAALGDKLFKTVRVFSVVVGGEGVPNRAIREVVLQTGGRWFAIHAAGGARRIAKGLGTGSALGALKLKVDGAPAAGLSAPSQLARGSGFMASTVWSAATAPRSIAVEGIRAGKKERFVARITSGRPAHPGAAFALRASAPDSIELIGKRADMGSRERVLAAAGHKAGLVSRYHSLVIPDPSSRFAKERLAFARKWGTELYRRAPSPAEQNGLGLDRFTTPMPSSSNGVRVRRRARSSGDLDKSTLGREIRSQLFRPVRHCYERSLRRNRKLAGTARVRFEILESEVVSAEVTAANGIPAAMSDCILDAAYTLNVPAASNDSGTTYLVTYPFKLRPSKKGGSVERGADEPSQSDPLDGL